MLKDMGKNMKDDLREATEGFKENLRGIKGNVKILIHHQYEMGREDYEYLHLAKSGEQSREWESVIVVYSVTGLNQT